MDCETCQFKETCGYKTDEWYYPIDGRKYHSCQRLEYTVVISKPTLEEHQSAIYGFDMLSWLNSNNKGDWTYVPRRHRPEHEEDLFEFKFELEEDAVKFKLTWN